MNDRLDEAGLRPAQSTVAGAGNPPRVPAVVKRAALVALRVAVVGAALWFVLRGVAWDAVASSLRHARPVLLVGVVALNAAMMAVKSVRLRLLLQGNASFPACFLAKLTASAVNNVLPFRGGDMARLWMLERHAGISKSAAAAIAVLEALFELLTLGGIALAGGLVSPKQGWAVGAAATLGLAAAALLVACRWIDGRASRPIRQEPSEGSLDLPRRQSRAKPGSVNAIRREPSEGSLDLPRRLRRAEPGSVNALLGRWARALAARVGPGVRALRDPGVVARAIALSALAWGLEAVMIVLCARALRLPVGPGLAPVILIAINLALAVPSSPAGAGAFEGAVVVVLTLAGIAKSPAVAFALLYHLIQVVPVTLAGALVVWRAGLTLNRLPAARPQASPVTRAIASPSQPFRPTV